MPIDSKEQEYQIARDGGVSKAGRKRTKKVFDDDMVYEPVTNTKKDVKPVKKKPDKPKICDVSKSGKKQKKKISQEVEVDEDGSDVAESELDEGRVENESDESYMPSASTKQSKQKSQKDDQLNHNSKSKKAKLPKEGNQETAVNEESSEEPPVKKVKKKRKPRTPKDDTSTVSRQIKQETALDYLKQWHQRRQEWHFKKLHQIWLLENKYKEDQITDAVFEVLLKYMEKIQGGARERTTQEAVTILENSDMQDSDKKTQRAREILYAIQDS